MEGGYFINGRSGLYFLMISYDILRYIMILGGGCMIERYRERSRAALHMAWGHGSKRCAELRRHGCTATSVHKAGQNRRKNPKIDVENMCSTSKKMLRRPKTFRRQKTFRWDLCSPSKSEVKVISESALQPFNWRTC